MTSNRTRHYADWMPGDTWRVSWLPLQQLTLHQAAAAMSIAEVVATEDLHAASPWWPYLDAWAADLGLTGPDAVTRAAYTPDDDTDGFAGGDT